MDNALEEFNELTPSERDKINLKIEINRNLVNFLGSITRKIENKNALQIKVEQELMSILEDPDIEVRISALTNLLAVLSKADNELAVGLLNVLKENQKVIINNPKEEEGPKKKMETFLTKDDVQKAKEVFETIGEIIKSEKSEEEIADDSKKPLF